MANKPQTIAITNFAGRLTRILNGDLNSGFAKFTNSFGYDPFSKPMNLTWLETASDITGPITGLPLTGKVIPYNSSGPNVHILDQGGRWYQISSSSLSNPNLNSVIAIQSVGGSNYLFGASMEFFGSVVGQDAVGNSLGFLYASNDTTVRRVNPNGSAEAVVGTAGRYVANTFKPLKVFAGKLIFGNGNTIGAIDSTGTVTSSVMSTGLTQTPIYSELNPALGTQARVMDLEVSPSNDYIIMAAANILQQERLDLYTTDFQSSGGGADGKLFQWNGSDGTVTAATSLPSYAITALETYFANTAFFSSDTFGTTFNDGTAKRVSLPNNKTPFANAVSVNGNFMTWACAEWDSTKRYMSLYYFGSLDEENPTGLYRVLRWETTQANGFVSQVPLNLVVSNKYVGINNAGTALSTRGYGKHYIGLSSTNSSTVEEYLLSFLVTPTGSGTPQSGVYETQTQMFSKRTDVKQIRVYTEPTVTGNGFRLDLIGSDGAVMDNGTFTYSFVAGSNINSLQGALERINFNPTVEASYAVGVRVTNTGSTNMTIKKIELDVSEEGR